jgi:hypothetical protein
MNKTNIKVELADKELEEKLKLLIDWAHKETLKDIISTYYSLRAQQHINEKEYSKIASLEWLVELHALL